jgi:osmotically-inducible protein OsmY
MKNIAAKLILTTCIATTSSAVLASNQWKKETLDAWIDGKAETTLLLNSNLNSFDINTDVKNKIVTLSGSVDNKTEKALAAELISGLDGVESVNNQLIIVKETPESEESSEVIKALTDSKITAVVKTRLLMSSSVSGTDIDVDTHDQTVTLQGHVESNSEHDLAMSIARNVSDVDRVIDKLEIIQ